MGTFETLQTDMEFATLHILLNNALGNVGSINCSHTYSKHHHTVRTTSLLHLPKLQFLSLKFLLFNKGSSNYSHLKTFTQHRSLLIHFIRLSTNFLTGMKIQSIFFRVSVHGVQGLGPLTKESEWVVEY